jgi:hypothetical protein
MVEEKRDNAGKIGLLWGLVLGAAFILSSIADTWAGQASAVVIGLFGVLSLLAQIGAPFAAGLLAARKHGGVGAGAFAGATAGTIGSLLLAVQWILLPGLMSPALAALGVGNVEGAALCNVPI